MPVYFTIQPGGAYVYSSGEYKGVRLVYPNYTNEKPWNFPAFFPAVVEHCADPWAVHFPAAPVAAIAIVHTARGLAETWSLSRPPEAVQAILSPRLARTLEIDRHFLEDVYTQLPERIPRFDPGPY